MYNLLFYDTHPSKPYDVESGINYRKGHIPNSAFMDIQEKLSNNDSDFKFTIPDYEILANNFQDLGIGDPYHIILYSGNGIQWATRVWWLVFILGFSKVKHA